MEYIVHTRFKGKAVCGDVNLPAMTKLECDNRIIHMGDTPICVETSQVSIEHFARNDDGEGMKRGKMTKAIMKALSTFRDPRTDIVYQAKWQRVWEDRLCQKYKRPEFADHWLWNHAFFNAPIEDLEYISNLVGAKEVA